MKALKLMVRNVFEDTKNHHYFDICHIGSTAVTIKMLTLHYEMRFEVTRAVTVFLTRDTTQSGTGVLTFLRILLSQMNCFWVE
jgi:ABC-type uncharacterized transport system substrate-binding protein